MRYFLFLSLLGLLACRKADGPDSSFTLTYQQPRDVATGGAVRATLTAVEDSRCPTGATCVWSGMAGVTVELTDAGATQKVAISLGAVPQPGYQRDSAAVTLNQQPYWLRLLSVDPYPTIGNRNVVKTATLRLRPR